MVDIARHQILQQAVEVCYAIEKCGASPELTYAVTLASALVQSIDKHLDSVGARSPADPLYAHVSHKFVTDASFGGDICMGCGSARGLSRSRLPCIAEA